ncbi:MAG: hypothetical protein MUF18_08670 [Fimbriiglobus sp.]|jgi:hypothetical protein|nr:hypothetical protein [Fimbriiglobus sp.]
MLPTTTARVPENTAESVNDRLHRRAEARVNRVAAGGTRAIAERLRELDAEWDTERTLEANASTLVVAGAALALLVDRRFALIPLVVGGFLLQHALQGWCPPLPIFRRLGVRTQAEIERERHALKAARGDFERTAGDPSRAIRAAGG